MNPKQQIYKYLVLKKLLLWFIAKRDHSVDSWNSFISNNIQLWQSAKQEAETGPNILIATSTGGHRPSATIEGLLAAGLTLRKANVHVFLCDGLLPGCLMCHTGFYPNHKQFIKHGPSRDLCHSCYKHGSKIYQSLGLQIHRYSEFVTPEEIKNAEVVSSTLPYKDISDYSIDGIAVGEHAMAGALRFYAKGNLEGEPYAEQVLRRYFMASLLTTFATRRLLDTFNYKCVVFNHGIYVPQGLIGEVCRSMNVRVVNWNPAYRQKCFIFSHGDTFHHTLMSEPVSKWENMKWDSHIEEKLMLYLKSRWHGTKDWISFQDNPEENLASIARQIGIDFSKPCIGMLTNVIWDAQLHYPANAFQNILEWVLQTIDYFSKRPDLQLLIRVHPAEILGSLPSRQRIVDEINKSFPVLPVNIFIIPPENKASTYVAMLQCNAVIIYGTKTGVELTSTGIPVIVAGEAWVRNKGITIDASSAEDYFNILTELPYKKSYDESTLERARKYAYHFFFRRMIPLEFMEPAKGNPPFKINIYSFEDLLPGYSNGLDLICDGILKGTDFIYPAEKYSETAR